MSNSDAMLARLRQLVAVSDLPAISPEAARKRLNHLCTSGDNESHEFRNRKNSHDPVAVLEDCHLRAAIAADELEKEVRRIWGDLMPGMRDADMATIRASVTQGGM